MFRRKSPEVKLLEQAERGKVSFSALSKVVLSKQSTFNFLESLAEKLSTTGELNINERYSITCMLTWPHDQETFNKVCYHFSHLPIIEHLILIDSSLTLESFEFVLEKKSTFSPDEIGYLLGNSAVNHDLLFKVCSLNPQLFSDKSFCRRFLDEKSPIVKRINKALARRGVETEGLPVEYILNLFVLESTNTSIKA